MLEMRYGHHPEEVKGYDTDTPRRHSNDRR